MKVQSCYIKCFLVIENRGAMLPEKAKKKNTPENYPMYKKHNYQNQSCHKTMEKYMQNKTLKKDFNTGSI